MTTSKSHFFSSFGTAHPTLQQYDCPASSLSDLLTSVLPRNNNPVSSWCLNEEAIQGDDILTWFQKNHHPAFYIPNGSAYTMLSYVDLHRIIKKSIFSYNANKKINTVAILLPAESMVETAHVMLTVMASSKNAVAAPLEPGMTPSQVQDALEQMQCQSLITNEDLWTKLNESKEGKDLLGLLDNVHLLQGWSKDLGLEWEHLEMTKKAHTKKAANDFQLTTNKNDDLPKLFLRTSGTTSKPKVVPITGPAMVYNAICLAAGLGIQRRDVKLNALPFYHIGGWNTFLAVLVTGSGIIMNGPFDPEDFCKKLQPLPMIGNTAKNKTPVQVAPTWYSGNPTINQALVLAIPKYMTKSSSDTFSNHLRFARSGAAHLSNETALRLSKLLDIPILPAYGMSECRPICLSNINPIRHGTSSSQDTVGIPIGPSVRILDDQDGSVLPYDSNKVGEVAVGGPGVITNYWGMNTTESHTSDGFLRTGDYGRLDQKGQLVLKGRKKELIKRGGEQVWPNEIDDAVELIPEVLKGVAFGVSNPLWGEEVAVAIVLGERAPVEEERLKEEIKETCRQQLKPAAVPVQIIFLKSMEELPRGPTGKVLRNNMASHLKVTAKDFFLQNALMTTPNYVDSLADCDDSDSDSNYDDNEESGMALSHSLNGLRFLAACFVLQKHVGSYPNQEWELASQFYQAPAIFLALGALQHAVTAKPNVLQHWVVFVGNKIGTMHALFVVTQVIALLSYLTLQCSDNDTMKCEDFSSLSKIILNFLGSTFLTPFFPYNAVNYYAWFQAAFYSFLILFPLTHTVLHKLRPCLQNVLLVVSLTLTVIIGPVIHYLTRVDWYDWDQTFLAWVPLFVATMLLAYRFLRVGTTEERIKYAGYVTDVFSLLLLGLGIFIAVGSGDGCVFAPRDLYEKLILQYNVSSSVEFTIGQDDYFRVCGISYTQFQDIENEVHGGRYMTVPTIWMSEFRVITPIVLLWLYFLSFDKGLTASLLRTKPFVMASPWAYHLYLLQLPVLRFYWLATSAFMDNRASAAWSPTNVNVPLEWYEVLLLIFITVLLGAFLQFTIVRWLMPHTTHLGVKICSILESLYFRFICCCHPSGKSQKNKSETSTYVLTLLKTLTGTDVTLQTDLKSIGLHSLGATALLSVLKSSIPSAKKLNFVQLAQMESVQELVSHLDGDIESVTDISTDDTTEHNSSIESASSGSDGNSIFESDESVESDARSMYSV